MHNGIWKKQYLCKTLQWVWPLVLHANECWESSNFAGNWSRHWTISISLSLTLFNVTHCGLAAVRTRSNNETQKSETGQERDCIQLLIKTFSSVTHMSGLFCLSNCVRGVYLVLKMRVFFCGFVTPGHSSWQRLVDYENTKITQHTLKVSLDTIISVSLQNVEVGHCTVYMYVTE